MKSKVTITIIICIVIIAALAVASWFVLSRDNNNSEDLVNSFDTCAAAGNPIQESFPEVCVTPDGQRFVNTVEEIQ